MTTIFIAFSNVLQFIVYSDLHSSLQSTKHLPLSKKNNNIDLILVVCVNIPVNETGFVSVESY